MMPAISLNALPALPPFQFLPEADLNFDAVLATVAPPAPQPPAAPEVSEPSETLLNFLGINPVKGQVPISDSPPVKEEMPDNTKDESSVTPSIAEPVLTLSPLSPLINEAIQIPPPVGAPLLRLAIGETQSKPSLTISAGDEADASTASRPDPVRSDSGAPVSPQLSEDATKTPLAPILNPFELAPRRSLSQPNLSTSIKPQELSLLTGAQPIEAGFQSRPLGVSVNGVSETSLSQPITATSDLSIAAGLGGDSQGASVAGVGETVLPQQTTLAPDRPTQPVAPSTDPLRFVVDRQLDLARDSRWLDALARDIVAVADASDRLSFRLSPPQLGQLDVNLSSSDGGLSVRMNASTEAATQIIAAAQPRLIDELKSQGVRVAEAHVSTGGGQSQGQGQQQQRDADQMIEFVRQRIERKNETNLTRPTGRFA